MKWTMSFTDDGVHMNYECWNNILKDRADLEAELAGFERDSADLHEDNERLHRFLTTREYEERVELEAKNKRLEEQLDDIGDAWRCNFEQYQEQLIRLEEQLEIYRERHRDAKSNYATIMRLREELQSAQELLLVGLYNTDIISQLQFDAGMELIEEEFDERRRQD